MESSVLPTFPPAFNPLRNDIPALNINGKAHGFSKIKLKAIFHWPIRVASKGLVSTNCISFSLIQIDSGTILLANC